MKTRTFIFFLSLILLLAATPANAELRPEKIRVVMDDNYPPFSFKNANGKQEGILIDQWHLWEQKTGIKVEIHAMDWSKAVAGMKNGEFDVIDTIFKTEERSEWLDFTHPYAKLEVPVFFDKEISGITDAASLQGFIVAAKKGDAAVELLKRNNVSNLILFNSYESIILAAKEHKVTVFVVDKPPALYFLHKYGVYDHYKQSLPLNTGEFHRAVKKGNQELLASINNGFQLISSDELKKIDKKWYGSSLESSFPTTPIFAGIGGLCLLVLILLGWNRSLKIHVEKQTTELRITEETIRKNEEKFRAVFEQGYYLAGLMDLDGTLTDVNNTALQFSGAEKAAVIGKPFWETPWWAHSPELQEKVRQAVKIAAQGTLVMLEATHPAPDGTLSYIDFSLRPVKDQSGAVIFLVPEGRDITDRKNAEETLEENQEKYRALSEAGFESIFFSTKGICTEQNKNAALMFGYSDSEAIGRPGTDWIVPEDRDLVIQHMVSGFEEPYEVTALRRDGTTFPALIRAKMMNYKGKEVRVTSLNDISDRKKAEEARMNMERQLLHSQKLESLGILSGGIAHDFNNLLQALLGNLELALMRLQHDNPARKNIDHAIKAGRHAAKLTNMMLAYSGKGLFVVKPLKLTELVEENAAMLEAAIPKSITLELQLDHTVPNIKADAGQLQQVIMNLITNAAEAIGDANGTICLSTGVGEFDRHHLNRSRLDEKTVAGLYVWLEVSDNGCGMGDDTQRKLFDPFFTTKFTGRGLGMSAVQGIIRAHKGAFLVDSIPGEGTTIKVLFPAVNGQPNRTKAASASEEAPKVTTASATRVLIVDDEEMIRAVTIAMLQELGFETVPASSGEEALALFREAPDRIDVVLLDQVMPAMDGVTVFKELRQICPDVKVLLASGFSQQEVSNRFKGLGLNGFIPKPYTLKNLSEELERVLKGVQD